VDSRDEIRQFLTSRRARINPEQAGLPTYGDRRRVPGLRRGEVATLANISTEYYTRLERGDARGASEEVLDAIARALQLDDTERRHLMDLVRAANPGKRPRRRSALQRVRPPVQLILDSMTEAAAFVRTARLDLLAANPLGYALYARAFSDPIKPPNLARFVFLDSTSQTFYADWDGIAAATVGSLRAEAGRDPYDRALTELVGELSTRSEAFRVRWAAHPVKVYSSGVQTFHHHPVGDLSLVYEALDLVGDPGLTIVAYAAEPGTPSQDGLSLLASWAASTPETTTPSASAEVDHNA
jgi:transcriptional regulator with XRE-family HTH domain